MYAKDIKILAKVFDKEFGYDFLKGDYVVPYGKGLVSDLVIKIHYSKEDFWNYKYFLSIHFTNPSDGLVPFYVDHPESDYKSDYLAPVTGYVGEWSFKRIRAGNKVDTNADRNRNYYFRVRTITNENGEIESAHYGKIYGEFPDINYYFNSTPNDRNVEFEPDHNLFKNLESGEYVLEP